MSKDLERIIMLWTTEDNKEHHRVFLSTEINEAEKHGKELWQKSAILEAEQSGKKDWEKDKKDILRNMSIFRGRHITWTKEVAPVITSFKLKEIELGDQE